MLRIFSRSIVLVMSTSCSAVNAQSAPTCKNSIEPGEPFDGRLMGIPYLIVGHVLAEKYCGAAPSSIKDRILGTIESFGCGPNTELYKEIDLSLSKPQNLDLKTLAADGNPDLQLSTDQVTEWARTAAEGLGGCAELVKAHDAGK